ncbi:MAG: radical SAM family heme chaperone HemW [Gemmatimonadota bacterium]|nr:radical SAM family heme chaperone HemW [Gemmatimonadota bacterium]
MLAKRHDLAQMTSVGAAKVSHLYIHVPFCARRCSYCDFSISVRAVTPVANYVESLRLELLRQRTTCWALDTIYLGGGTPSRLGSGVADVIKLVRDSANVARDAEITIEVNPDDVNPEAAAAWVAAGVNRVSLGAQSFQDHVLEWMHRTHSAGQTLSAVKLLRDAGIANLSLDLIFSLPDALGRDWSGDVQRALELTPEHVSLYGLTVEPHTPLGRWTERGDTTEAPEERYEDEFLLAHEVLGAADFEHYEVSNFGRPGRRSRHNSSYWTGSAYAALGPSAHSYDGFTRSWNVPAHADWERRLRTSESVIAGSEMLSDENRQSERVYLGLRTSDGLRATDAEIELARPWVQQGWATIVDETIVLTARGFLRLDSLAASLTLAESR